MSDFSGEKEFEVKAGTAEAGSTTTTGNFDTVTGVKRGLRTRHLSMMALAGIIGPGLLVGAGGALAIGGPGALIIGFGVIGFIAYAIMQTLGEMTTLYPSGGGFLAFTDRFVNKPFCFVVGWNYFVVWAAVLANEYNTISSVMESWSSKVPIYGYFLIFWFAFSVFQMLGVTAFGEAEFWLALVKIFGLLAYFIFSIVYVSGGIHNHKAFGFHYWNEPGAWADGFRGVAQVFVFASTFYAGVESVAVAATETKNPTRAIPLAIRQVVWRILFVYLGTALFYGITVPYNHPLLTRGGSKALQSPITAAIRDAGWYGGVHLVNAFILITCLSAVNSSVYIGSRTMLFLANRGLAPRILARTNKKGVPWVAMLVTNLFGFLSLMNINEGAQQAYSYIVNLSGVSIFIVWAGLAFTHFRFRRAWKLGGRSVRDLPFRDRLYPVTPLFALVLNVVLALVQGWTTLSPFKGGPFVDAYILLPVSAIAYVLVGFVKKEFKWRPIGDIDLDEDRRFDLEEQVKQSRSKRILGLI